MFGQDPGRFRLFEEDGEAVLRRDHRRAGEPGMQPHPFIKTQRMTGIQTPHNPTFRAQGATRRATGAEPGADLDRPRLAPLPCCTECKSQLGLGERDVFAQLEADAERTPFPRVIFIVRMPRHADHTSQQIAAATQEVVL